MGFGKYARAPAEMPAITLGAEFWPVRKITGTRRRASCSFMRFTIEMPSSRGIHTSVRTTSGAGSCFVAISSPSTPSPAVMTSYS
jgi:hypothetical protein